MTARTSHVHILDTGEGDWGAHPNRASANRAAKKILEEVNSFMDVPMAEDEITIVDSEEWCADSPEPCEYDRNRALLEAMRRPPIWRYDFPSLPTAVYRIDGRRIPRWKMACSMTIDQAMELWPFTGHPVAIPIWHYDIVIADRNLCPCSNRSHRRKGCIVGPSGLKCSICGALHQDYGNGFHHCLPCQDWLDRREAYLADWAAERMDNASMAAQLSLL